MPTTTMHDNSSLLHKRIIVSVTNDLVTDQRVHRSCSALVDAGCEVVLVGRLLKDSRMLSRQYKTVRMRLLFDKKVFFYAEYNIRLFLRLFFSKADVFYTNDTDTLLANYLAARLRRKPLFFDAHELFPEMPELVGRKWVKRFWTRIEDFVFPRIAKRDDMAAVTVCQSIADIYKERYGIEMAVVRNVPMEYPSDDNGYEAKADILLAHIPADKKILLYQGAVNMGRGIEWVIAAMPLLPDCHFVVAGTGDEYSRLSKENAAVPNVTFLGRVEPPVLHCLTRKAALGMSLLENKGLNYYYSLPNRLADFIQAGVPVVATDFPEIRKVVATYGVGTLVSSECNADASGLVPQADAEQLARTVSDALSYWQELPKSERESRFSRASSDLSWKNDKKTLLLQIGTIIN